jgi:hypothetical protein
LFDETTRLGRGMLYAVNKYPHGNDKPSHMLKKYFDSKKLIIGGKGILV